jgi:diacylglycerol kinase (ATP)
VLNTRAARVGHSIHRHEGPAIGSRALVLINEKSSHGRAQLDAGLSALYQADFELIIARVGDPAEICRQIRDRAQDIDFVILGGGDGTMHHALPALLATDAPLAVLPMGTANDLARTLRIPLDPVQALAEIPHGRVHAIDLARIGDRHFINDASLGLSTTILRHASAGAKRWLGVLGYALSVFGAVRSARPFEAVIICDGRGQRVRTVQITLGNGAYHGGGLVISKDAAIDDGLLDLYHVKPVSWLGLFRVALRMRQGRHHELAAVQLDAGARITIVTDRPMQLSTDGEITVTTPVTVECLPGALRVLVPPAFIESRAPGASA